MSNFVERESLENYLETIYTLEMHNKEKGVRSIDIVNHLNLSRASVSRAINTLKNNNYITVEKFIISLTSEGKVKAEEIFKRHSILIKYLKLIAKVSDDVASRNGCRMEHVISNETVKGITEFLIKNGINISEDEEEVVSHVPMATELMESSEDYLENIYLLLQENTSIRSVDVVNKMGVSRASTSRALSILKEKELIEIGRIGQINLLPKGEEKAKSIYERHQVISQLLQITAAISNEVADEEACRIEHMLSDDVFEGIKTFVQSNFIQN